MKQLHISFIIFVLLANSTLANQLNLRTKADAGPATLLVGTGLVVLSINQNSPGKDGLKLAIPMLSIGMGGATLLGESLELEKQAKSEYKQIEKTARIVERTKLPSNDITYNQLASTIEFKSARNDEEQHVLFAKLVNQLQHVAKYIVEQKQSGQSLNEKYILSNVRHLLGDDYTEQNLKIALAILNAAIISLESKE